MAGCAIKNHYFDTAVRAKLLQEQFPQLRVAGGVTLNRSVGGVNPDAVERPPRRAASWSGFPPWRPGHTSNISIGTSPVQTCPGFCRSAMKREISCPRRWKCWMWPHDTKWWWGLVTLGADEGMALVRAAAERGCTVVLTHADNPADCYSIQQQQEAVALGAYVEHSFFTTYHNRTPIEEIARQIRAVGCEHVLLTTDFGQLNSLYSDEGMEEYARVLMTQGFTAKELGIMMRQVPERLLEGMSSAD